MSSSSWPYKSEMYLQGGRFKLCQFVLVVWRAGPISGLCCAQACEGSSCPCGHALKQHNPIWTSVGQLLSFMKNLWFQFWFHSSSTKHGTLGPVLVWFFEKKNSGSGSVSRQHCSGPVILLQKIQCLAKMLAFVRSEVSDSYQVGEHFFSSDYMKILFDSIFGWWDEMHQNQR